MNKEAAVERVPEPELMDDDEQARAYAEADFADAHDGFVSALKDALGDSDLGDAVLDEAAFAHHLPSGVIGLQPQLRVTGEAVAILLYLVEHGPFPRVGCLSVRTPYARHSRFATTCGSVRSITRQWVCS